MSKVFHTKESKSLLAKLMSEENITVRHEKIETAYFDVKNRVLALPIWQDMSNDLYDLLVGHEVGHALYTPEEGLLEAVARSNQSFVNVIEDARIEKLMKRKFAGLRTSFIKGYQDLEERNFFEMNGVSPSNVAFIDRINYFFKTATANQLLARDWFSDEEMVWVDRISAAETFQEVDDIAADLFAHLKEKQENQQEQEQEQQSQSSPDGEEGDNSGESMPSQGSEDQQNDTDGSGDADSDDASEENGEDETSNKKSKSEENTDESEEEEKTEKSGQKEVDEKLQSQSEQDGSILGGKEGGTGGTAIDELKSNTDDAMSRNSQNLVDRNAREITYVNKVNNDVFNRHVNDWTVVIGELESQIGTVSDMMPDFNSDNKNAISYLVKEFEMKKSADAHARSMTANSGQINASKLWSYQINEDIFKKKTVLPDGKNHGMIMFVDWSGSMHGSLYSTVRQTVTLAMFCRRVGIPFEVYGFNDNGRNGNTDQIDNNNVGDIIIDKSLNLRNYISHRMNANQFKTACNLILNVAHKIDNDYWSQTFVKDGLSGTPLNAALWCADEIIYRFRRENGLQKVNLVVLTDGENGGWDQYVEDYGSAKHVTSFMTYRRTKVVMTDKQTNKVFTNNDEDSTNFILRFLREKHNINAIGFYLVGSRRSDARNAVQNYVAKNYNDVTSLVRKLRKENFLVSKSTGYNEYYIVNAVDTKSTELEVNSDMTKGRIAKAFAAHSSSKKSNRQLLNKFVDLVK